MSRCCKNLICPLPVIINTMNVPQWVRCKVEGHYKILFSIRCRCYFIWRSRCVEWRESLSLTFLCANRIPGTNRIKINSSRFVVIDLSIKPLQSWNKVVIILKMSVFIFYWSCSILFFTDVLSNSNLQEGHVMAIQ